MPTVPRRSRERDGHFVVCGDNPLAYWLVDELAARVGLPVTAVMASRKGKEGARIARLPNVRVVEAEELDETAFRAARVEHARAVALVGGGDVANIHAALRAAELNPGVRLVIRVFNSDLGQRVRTLLPDCAVMSDSAMAAPSFVAAALGESTPSHVRISGRTLCVVPRASVPAERALCAITRRPEGGPVRLLPPEEDSELVLAVADGTPREGPARRRRRRRRLARARDRLLAFFNRKLGYTLLALLALLVAGTVITATMGDRKKWPEAVYLTLLEAAGAANPDLKQSGVNQLTQVMVTLVGITLIPVVTAVVVDAVVTARLTGTAGRGLRAVRDHVVVVGLGNVGTRVLAQLHDLGIPAVGVERDQQASGVAFARRLGIPVVIGNASRADTLRAASVDTCQSLLALARDDITNLGAALHARSTNADLRVVLRLFDDDFADRVQRSFGITTSRSVSYLAAPAFAAAMMERQVIATIPLGRRVLLVADVCIGEDSPLQGCPVAEAHHPGEARVIAVQRRGEERLDWSPHSGYLLAAEDRLIVVATRVGLGRALARSHPSPVPGPAL